MPDTPRLDPAKLVREFVAKAHGDLERVGELLRAAARAGQRRMGLGGGDWETALGAAAHVGRRDIALLLLEHGARMDIFAAAMLGHLDIVRATLAAIPAARDWRGPHGIALLRHAEAGGATAVVEFLQGAL